jgi:hypothetical protein
MDISDYDKQHIVEILGGEGNWFGAHLIRLIAKADLHNRHLLGEVYPEHVEAYLKWYNKE